MIRKIWRIKDDKFPPALFERTYQGKFANDKNG